jgi:predicted anti-sigma-YlaC factor YlaD
MSMFARSSVCPYQDRLEAFWDAEVSPEECRRIEAHLTGCAACRRRLQELQSLAVVLKAYRTPTSAWPNADEFWLTLAPQLHPRAMPAQEGQARQPSPFLAPVSLVVSSFALRGVAALALIAYALYQWQLLPAAVSAAFASALQLFLGPLVWQRSQVFYNNLMTSLTPFLVAPAQVWLLAFEATASALLLLLAGLHIGWVLRWLSSQDPAQTMMGTE